MRKQKLEEAFQQEAHLIIRDLKCKITPQTVKNVLIKNVEIPLE